MPLFETLRQGLIVAAELAALAAVTPTFATVPLDRAPAKSSADETRRLHALASAFDPSLRSLALLRLADAIDAVDDIDDDDPGCGSGEADESDIDEPSPHVRLQLDEAIADVSVSSPVAIRHTTMAVTDLR